MIMDVILVVTWISSSSGIKATWLQCSVNSCLCGKVYLWLSTIHLFFDSSHYILYSFYIAKICIMACTAFYTFKPIIQIGCCKRCATRFFKYEVQPHRLSETRSFKQELDRGQYSSLWIFFQLCCWYCISQESLRNSKGPWCSWICSVCWKCFPWSKIRPCP